MRILVLSGASLIQYPTLINHRLYADRHDYRYRFAVAPAAGVANLFFHKLLAIQDALQDCDWLFWLDDDAAFMQPDQALETVVPEMAAEPFAIFCKSPINLKGGWTYLSSGNFFLRNCAASHFLISQCLRTDLDSVKAWWDPNHYGMFTNGDQDAIVYHLVTDPNLRDNYALLDYTRFNTRPYHFKTADNEHFLVHFTYSQDMSKRNQMREFARRFGLSEHLVAHDRMADYFAYLKHQSAMTGGA